MMKTIWKKSISILLVLMLTAAFLPTGFALAAGGADMPSVPPPVADSSDSGDDEFAPGEVLASADSWEQAQAIADAYGMKLESYAYGIAVLATPDPELAVARSGMTRGGAKLGFNWLYHSCDSSVKNQSNYSTHQHSAMTYNSNQKTAAYRAETGMTVFSKDDDDEIVDEPEDLGQWHRAEIDADRAWTLSTGNGVVIAMIDTGIDIENPAFAGRISAKSYNAYTDEIGLEYVRDDIGHGTHVSGIAAASMDAAADVSGVAPSAVILAIKANEPDWDEYWSVDLYRAINYATLNGADIINMSLGRFNANGENADDLEHAVIAKAVANGVTVVCAAGNWSYNHAFFPAAYPESIAVSATMQGYVFDNWHSSSNYGPEIDISAPGGDIYSTAMGGGYEYLSGTSMASPNVAGVAALIKALNPAYTPQHVRDTLCATARDAGEVGRDDYYGYGIVNAYASVLGPANLFSVKYDFMDSRAPVTVKVTPGNTLLKPDSSIRDGYAFDGWFVSGTVNEYDFASIVQGDLKLDAKWVVAADSMYVLEFPDVIFRREVLSLLNEWDGGCRKDSSFIVDDLDLLGSIEELRLWGLGVCDMTGLQHFSGLIDLTLSFNQLTALDVSGNTALEILYCPGNKLTELDVSANTSLTVLSCFGNLLGVLDVSKNTALEWLFCFENELEALNVSNNICLQILDCSDNQLSTLNVSGNIALEELWCGENPLGGLDLSKNDKLEELYCYVNGLAVLDVTANPQLRILVCEVNNLTTLDLSNNPELLELWCYNNQLSTLDFSNNTALEHVSGDNNQLETVNVSKSPALERLWLDENKLASISVSSNTSLVSLSLDGNQLTVLDLSNNSELRDLSCAGNQLTKLDVSKNTKLMQLFCLSNALTILDVSGCTSLELLNGSYNLLTSLDVSKNASLKFLYFYGNQLTALDVSKNAFLRHLGCGYNLIATLDVSKNGALMGLWCHDNQLSALDVSNNTALSLFECQDNLLSALDVSKNIWLRELDCGRNNLTELDISNNTALQHLICTHNYMASIDSVVGWQVIPELILDETFYFFPQRRESVDITADFIDPNFRAAVYEAIGKTAPEPIMSSDVEEIPGLYISDRGIRSLAGLEHFSGLYELICDNNLLIELPALPDGLVVLNCQNNLLSLLPELPDSLVGLYCYNNRITSLPALPDGIINLDCDQNYIMSLPKLPSGLRTLDCSRNQIAELPDLPSSLEILYCFGNKLTALPTELPSDLGSLICSENQIELLPALPSGLGTLICSMNILTSPLTLPDGLYKLDCNRNRLTGLDLTGLTELEYLDCRWNYMTDEDDVTGLFVDWSEEDEEWSETGKYFWPQQESGFKAVWNIVGLQRFATCGDPLVLTGTAIPTGVTSNIIEWSIADDPDETGAFIDGNVFKAVSTGVVSVLATVSDEDTDYVSWSFQYPITVLPKTYKVTFNPDGGTRLGGGPLSQTVLKGGSATPPIVSKPGYCFDDWDKDFSNVTENMTVTATWTRVYTVTYNLNDGTGTLPTETDKAEGETFTAATTSGITAPSGKQFKEWNATADGTGTGYAPGDTVAMPAYDLALYAIWEDIPLPPTYTVTYYLNGGSGTPPVGTDKVESETFAAATTSGITAPSGKRFKEWNTEADGTGTGYAPGDTVTMPADNLTLYAIWEDIPVTTTYTITFDLNDGSVSSETMQTGADGKLASLPTPTRSGSYSFDGWFTAVTGGTKVTTDTVFTGNDTVHAHWTDTSGGSLGGNLGSGGESPDDTTDETLPEITTPLTGDWVNPYSDVLDTNWFFEAVSFVTEKELMTGTGDNKFSPNVTMSRAMMVTVLYRLEGKPTVSGNIPFSDVAKDQWYSDAILWASENDIVNGYNNGTYGWNDDVTREQAVAILYRYAKAKGLDVSASDDLSGFVDADTISDWALEAMRWAVAVGIIEGRSGNTVAPQATSTRAEVATIFRRYMNDFLSDADELDE